MAAIEHVAELLHESESTDVEMRSPGNEESDRKVLSSSMKDTSSTSPTASVKFTQSPVEAENKEFQAKFSAIGTSSRPHHSGKKKVVRIVFSCTFFVCSRKLSFLFLFRRSRTSSSSKCSAKEPSERLFSAVKKPLAIYTR